MPTIVPLNLPKTNLKLTKTDEQLFVNCLVRKKKIVLTPEEWVRQHFISFFIEKLCYPKGLLTIEKKNPIRRFRKKMGFSSLYSRPKLFFTSGVQGAIHFHHQKCL